MAKLNDLVGQQFGRLTVIKRASNYKESVMWMCICECGVEHTVRGTSLRAGYTKSCGCYHKDLHKSRVGEKSPGWKGGKLRQNGYILVLIPFLERKGNRSEYIQEHILVMEKELGRELTDDETVHHINGIRDDNRPENLEVWSSNHPKGQRTEDKVSWAVEVLRLYRPELLSKITGGDLETN